MATRRHGASFSGRFEQGASLGFDNGEIVFGGQVARLHGRELAHFAFCNCGRGCREPVQDVETVGFNKQVEGAGKQEVAHEDGRLVAPYRLGSGLAAAQIALVDDIIVQERGGMDEFDRGCERMGGAAGLADRLR